MGTRSLAGSRPCSDTAGQGATMLLKALDRTHMGNLESTYDEAAEWIAGSTFAVAFSGAGVSAESGIATFRDPGGLWERFDPMEVATAPGLVNKLRSDPGEFVEFFRDVMDTMRAADPNPGHRALGELEELGKLRAVVTQNVDNLHQEGGSRTVLELHGNTFRLECIECRAKDPLDRPEFFRRFDEIFEGVEHSMEALLGRLPRCGSCDSLQRLDVVLFGEAVHNVADAFELARRADLILVLGTSGMVYPAADLPRFCRSEGGGRVIVVNPNENAFSHLGGLFVPERSGVALPAIVERVRERVGTRA